MAREYERPVIVKSQVAAPIGPLLFDDAEGSLKWIGSGTGTDWVVEKSDAIARGGTYSVRLKTKATTPAKDDYVQAGFAVSPKPQKYLRFRAYAVMPTDAQLVLIVLNLGVAIDNELCYAELIYDVLDHRIGYLDEDDTRQYYTDQRVEVGVTQIAELELILNTAKKEYVSIRVNHKLIDMSGIKYTAPIEGGYLSTIDCTLRIEATYAEQQDVCFDDILVDYLD